MKKIFIIAVIFFLYNECCLFSKTIHFNYHNGITKTSTDNGITWCYFMKYGHRIEILRLNGIKKISEDFGKTWKLVKTQQFSEYDYISAYCSGNFFFLTNLNSKKISRVIVYDNNGNYIISLKPEETEFSDTKIEINYILSNGVYFFNFENNGKTIILCKLLINR